MKKLLALAVMSLLLLVGCTEWNPLFDGFGGIPIAHDGGSMLDAGPALSGKCDVGMWNVCTGCNGEPEIQRCLDGDWQPCPCSPDLGHAPVDLGVATDLVTVADLAIGPDMAMECRPGEVQACVVCMAVGTKRCDQTGHFSGCMLPNFVECFNVGGTRPYKDQFTCSTDVVQTCQPNCSWGKPHLKTVPDGCGICDPIDGAAGCGGSCKTLPKCTFYQEAQCAMGSGVLPPTGEANFCGTDYGGQDHCDNGLACHPDEQRCRRVCNLANPMCPQGRTCKPAKNQNTKCYGFCVP